MKASDIAVKNHVSFLDIQEVCKELSIPCEKESDEISEKDLFLIGKKIESIKIKNAEKNKKGKKIKLKRKVHVPSKEKQKDGSANKTVADSSGKEKNLPSENKDRPVKKEFVAKKTNQSSSQNSNQRDKKPSSNYRGRNSSAGNNRNNSSANNNSTARKKVTDQRVNRSSANRGTQSNSQNTFRNNKGNSQSNFVKKSLGSTEKPAALEIEDPSKRRKKDKDKEKDKSKEHGKYKKQQSEKQIHLKKKDKVVVKKEITTPSMITITEGVSVGELAKKLNLKANDVIAKLMKLGVMATINQILDSETVEILADEYNTEVKVVSLYDETVIKSDESDNPEDQTSRPPVVTVMGHVDHGKTKLLDAIRETDVVAGEHGGITQHIGAYKVKLADGNEIAFLDTPGHAAFTTMRARGAGITDIVILVVAANDGVMPQTIEAINHAKAANVPIIVAINKIDLEDANTQKVRQELSNYELIPEEWGGTTLFAEISAKKKINIEGLLELVMIQTEMMELKANPKLRAQATVVEARLDQGRGAVATILVQKGTLKIGDPFVVGIFSGKVRAMFDGKGKKIKEAGPSTPVEVFGIAGVPAAGDPFEVVESEKVAKQFSQKRMELKRVESAKSVRKVTLESLNEMIKDGEVQELNVIVKADVDGSAQALKESLEKLSNEEIRIMVIHTGTGGINESDVMLAAASSAIIIGFHVRPTGKVSEIAQKERVSIKFYNIIFEATDDMKAAMEGMLSPEFKEEVTGTGEIKQIFKISKIGTIAGALCSSGKINKKSKIRLIRDGVVVFNGELKSLKRFKDDASEIIVGQEFGFSLDGFNDIKEGDNFEAYTILEIAKTL